MPKSFNKEDLAEEVKELLDLPSKAINIRASKEYKVVTAIVNSMKEALLRGEEIHIAGFGIFRARTLPAKKRMCGYFYRSGNRHPYQVMGITPSRTYIHFSPSKVLKRMVNEESS